MEQYMEECANCLKEMVFTVEDERKAAMDAYVGEILCASCRAEVEEDG
jgi:hypothetical protein